MRCWTIDSRVAEQAVDQSGRSTRSKKRSDVQSLGELNTWLKQTVEKQTDPQRIRVCGMA
jgi:hypothetical protein